MIKINKSREVQKISIEYNLYIPIDIKFGSWNNTQDPTIYWRTGDFQKSLIEIGIGKNNKEVRSITVVICDKVFDESGNYRQFSSITVGCPIVTINNLKENVYIDEIGFVEMYFEEESVYIFFSEIEANNCMKNGDVEFLLDSESNWVGVSIKNINENDMGVLKSSLK